MASARNWLNDRIELEKFSDCLKSVADSGLTHISERDSAKPAIYIASIFAVLSLFLVTHLYRHLTPPYLSHTPRSPDTEKSTDLDTFASKCLKPSAREPGTWTPSTWTRPPANPCQDWSITDTRHLPYRPFRHGPYHITMGLRTMHWDDWIELDNQYPLFHADKARRIAERGSKCCRTDTQDPRAFEGAVELLEELAEYLPQRYPSLFRRTPVGINNLWSGEIFDIRASHLSVNGGAKEDPMQFAARLIQDDLAIMFEGQDGQYYLLAGAILLAGFWRLEDKFGMPLSEIHTSGDVPGYKEKLEKGMMNFFRRVQPEKAVLRNNYFLQVDDNLAWSESIGSEDSDAISWSTAQKDIAIENHFFRSERQSLRRLPRSGGVVFTIRTYFEPVTAIAEELGVPGRLASAVRSWGEDVARYKGRERYGEVLLVYLDRRHEEHVRDGLVGEGEEEGKYPW